MDETKKAVVDLATEFYNQPFDDYRQAEEFADEILLIAGVAKLTADNERLKKLLKRAYCYPNGINLDSVLAKEIKAALEEN